MKYNLMFYLPPFLKCWRIIWPTCCWVNPKSNACFKSSLVICLLTSKSSGDSEIHKIIWHWKREQIALRCYDRWMSFHCKMLLIYLKSKITRNNRAIKSHWILKIVSKETEKVHKAPLYSLLSDQKNKITQNVTRFR